MSPEAIEIERKRIIRNIIYKALEQLEASSDLLQPDSALFSINETTAIKSRLDVVHTKIHKTLWRSRK